METDTEPRPSPLPFDSPRTPSVAPGRRSHRWRWVAVALVIPLLLAAGAMWYFVLRHEAPPIATLDQAVAGIQAPTASDLIDHTAAASSPVSGTWTIDGTITNAQGTGSYAAFRVEEILTGVGSTTAVGRTTAVEGTLEVEGSRLSAATISADLTSITSNDSRRDSAIQRALATSRYPSATFVLTAPVDVGSVPAEGQRIDVSATGELTIHGVTRQVTVPLQAQLQSGVLVVIGTTDVSFADYGVTAPTAPIVASVENHATVELQLYFTKG